ncbi:cell wall hydrolase [Streptomyces sp. NPDC059740]|uniref:cell wall hydrolase n=1 Tax=Streptomyces sp. NPDC059740 TaxID=3346926 RepID=UPI003661A693
MNESWAGRPRGSRSWPAEVAKVLEALPPVLFAVPYSGAHPPQPPALAVAGERAAAPRPDGLDLTAGANCQRYAYAVLAHHGRRVPPLRSAELWADASATVRAPRPAPLDLVLFDAGPVPGRAEGYGAHVGVHLGPDAVLHLCREVGRPAVWRYGDFAARARYARFLGAKRVLPAHG